MPARVIVNVGVNLPAQLTRHPDREVRRARDTVKRSLGGQVQVVTTHSEAFVNELAALIAYGKLAPDEVEVRMHDGDVVGSDFRTFKFDREGCLMGGWPFGFFSGSLGEWKDSGWRSDVEDLSILLA